MVRCLRLVAKFCGYFWQQDEAPLMLIICGVLLVGAYELAAINGVILLFSPNPTLVWIGFGILLPMLLFMALFSLAVVVGCVLFVAWLCYRCPCCVGPCARAHADLEAAEGILPITVQEPTATGTPQ